MVYKPSVRELLDGRHRNHSRDVSVTKSDDITLQVHRESTHRFRRRHKCVFRVTNAFKRFSIVEGQIANIRQDEFLVHLLGQRVRCSLQGTIAIEELTLLFRRYLKV